jgi:hypothetical protein
MMINILFILSININGYNVSLKCTIGVTGLLAFLIPTTKMLLDGWEKLL